MHTVYDDAVAKLPAEEEVHARHILFRAAAGDDKAGKEAEDKAKAVVARLNKGEDFQKIADTAEFKRRLAFNRNRLLMDEMLQKEGKAAVTDAALRKVYEEAVKQMGDEQEVRARHILVETEDQAKEIVAELKKGANFEELAKTKSKDPGAAAQGGDLGYFTKEQMVPEFADAAFKMEKGQVSDPVKSQFGWHIIRVEDKRKKPAPEFAAVKAQLETYVTRKAQADLVTKLRDSAKIERLDKKDDAKPADTKPDAKPADKK